MGNNRCEQCGAVLPKGTVCGQCGVKRSNAPVEASPFATVEEASEQNADVQGAITSRNTLQFGIAYLLLVTLFVSLLLAILRVVPGLGFVLITFLTPAFVRASVLSSRARAVGRPLTASGHALAFLASIGLVTMTLMSVGLAFYITCWGGFFAGALTSEVLGAQGFDPLGYGLATGIVVGIVGQILFLVLFIRWLWRRRDQQRNRLGDIGFIISSIGFSVLFASCLGQLSWPLEGSIALAPWGFSALLGFVLSLIALPRTPRHLASIGTGVGAATCVATSAVCLLAFGGAATNSLLALILLLTALAAIAASFGVHFSVRKREAA